MLTSKFIKQCIHLIFLSCCVRNLFANQYCDDWTAYKDEKCFKVIETLQSYDDSKRTCIENNSTLVSIFGLEEQNFITNFLFTTSKVVDNVWIGMKYVSNESNYRWFDDTGAMYTNWAQSSPKNISDYCVQIDSDQSTIGLWTDVACNKHNAVLCQKKQIMTLEKLSEMVLSMRKQLQNTNKQIEYFFSNKWIHFKAFADSTNNRKALIYPYKNKTEFYRTEAIELCNNNNATLVDIETIDKQKLVESFLYEINPKTEFTEYWIGAYAPSNGKYKWMNSGSDLNYTNWATDNPIHNRNYTFIYANFAESSNGKWYSTAIGDTNNVFCEILFSF